MTAEHRVVVIGIDGLDADLLLRFRSILPNFSELMDDWSLVRMSSVFPPDSPTAWASAFTGLNPARHGIVSFKDPLSRSKVGEYLENVNNIRGRTFWDFAGRYGKKCCIIFPHLAYPPWPVNGTLVSRTTEVDIKKFDIKTHPPDLPLGCDPAELKPITSYPFDPGHLIQPTKQLILNEVKFGTRLLKESDWDVFFIFFSSLDNIEHNFWMYFDKADQERPKLNQYRDVIPNFYKFYDEHVIGRFLSILGSDVALIVLSDHGHASRPYNVVNINEFLERAKLLKTKIRSTIFSDIKVKLTRVINETRVYAKFVSKILSLFPRSLEFYTSLSPIDWSQTTAYLSDSSAGVKTYSYAGVRVKEGTVSPLLYERIRQSIVEILMQIKDPTSSEKLVEWAIRREELYKGPFLSKYPDVVFKLKEDWGTGWGTNSLYGRSPSHNLFSGTHRQESAVFTLSHSGRLKPKADKVKITDVAPTILDLLGIDKPHLYRLFDGRSIFSI